MASGLHVCILQVQTSLGENCFEIKSEYARQLGSTVAQIVVEDTICNSSVAIFTPIYNTRSKTHRPNQVWWMCRKWVRIKLKEERKPCRTQRVLGVSTSALPTSPAVNSGTVSFFYILAFSMCFLCGSCFSYIIIITIHTCRANFYFQNQRGLPVEFYFIELLRLNLAFTMVKFKGNAYVQKTRICIGSCVAPVLYDIFLFRCDRDITKNLSNARFHVCSGMCMNI